jgi:hypothetical protein
VGDVVNLNAARVERRPPELDHQCRDCGRVCCSLAELAGHYMTKCRRDARSRAAHPSNAGAS